MAKVTIEVMLQRALGVMRLTPEEMESFATDEVACGQAIAAVEDARRALRERARELAELRDTHLRNRELDELEKRLGPKGMQMLLERAQKVELERVASQAVVKDG